MGFRKTTLDMEWVGGVSSIQFFWDLFNFAKPLLKLIRLHELTCDNISTQSAIITANSPGVSAATSRKFSASHNRHQVTSQKKLSGKSER